AGTGDRGGGGRRPPGAAGRLGEPGRGAGRPRPAARAALALRPRRLPQGNRPHRPDPGRRAARQRRSRRMTTPAPTSTPDSAGCRPSTIAVRAGIDADPAHGAVTPPIVLSSNFSFDGFGNKRRYDYTRSGNPTRDLLAEALAGLEGGAGAVVTAT